MKKIIFILMLLPLLSFGQYTGFQNVGVFNFPINDTITQGDSVSIDIKYSITNMGQPDTLKIQLYPALNFICSIPANTIFAIPSNSDGTRTIKFKLPLSSPVGSARFYLRYDLNPVNFYIRSKSPDISITQLDNTIDTTGQDFSLKIDYTFLPKTSDTLKIFIGDSLVYKGVYTKSLISFHIPYFNYSNTYPLTITGWIGSESVNITKPSHTVSGIFDPIATHNQDVHYYNEQGTEIQKPTEGFYIWKTKNGHSGKGFVVLN
jgi:hypothetical protein